MNPTAGTLEQQREQVLEQMRSIERLRRGSFRRQFFKLEQAGRTVTRGPYYLLQGFIRGRKFAERVPAEVAEQVGQQVQDYQRFQQLAERFVTVTDQLTRLADQAPGSKKNSRRRRSPPNASERPKPS
jgi:hypothetical protein